MGSTKWAFGVFAYTVDALVRVPAFLAAFGAYSLLRRLKLIKGFQCDADVVLLDGTSASREFLTKLLRDFGAISVEDEVADIEVQKMEGGAIAFVQRLKITYKRSTTTTANSGPSSFTPPPRPAAAAAVAASSQQQGSNRERRPMLWYPASLVLKTSGLTAEMVAKEALLEFHRREVYSSFGGRKNKSRRTTGTPDSAKDAMFEAVADSMPHCVYANTNFWGLGYLLVEDLGASGCRQVRSRHSAMAERTDMAMWFEEVARLHGASWCCPQLYTDPANQRRLTFNLPQFGYLLDTVIPGGMVQNVVGGGWGGFVRKHKHLHAAMVQVTRHRNYAAVVGAISGADLSTGWGGAVSPQHPRCHPARSSSKQTSPFRFFSLIHNDYRYDNAFFDDTAKRAVAIDWQTLHADHPLVDVMWAALDISEHHLLDREFLKKNCCGSAVVDTKRVDEMTTSEVVRGNFNCFLRSYLKTLDDVINDPNHPRHRGSQGEGAADMWPDVPAMTQEDVWEVMPAVMYQIALLVAIGLLGFVRDPPTPEILKLFDVPAEEDEEEHKRENKNVNDSVEDEEEEGPSPASKQSMKLFDESGVEDKDKLPHLGMLGAQLIRRSNFLLKHLVGDEIFASSPANDDLPPSVARLVMTTTAATMGASVDDDAKIKKAN